MNYRKILIMGQLQQPCTSNYWNWICACKLTKRWPAEGCSLQLQPPWRLWRTSSYARGKYIKLILFLYLLRFHETQPSQRIKQMLQQHSADLRWNPFKWRGDMREHFQWSPLYIELDNVMKEIQCSATVTVVILWNVTRKEKLLKFPDW